MHFRFAKMNTKFSMMAHCKNVKNKAHLKINRRQNNCRIVCIPQKSQLTYFTLYTLKNNIEKLNFFLCGFNRSNILYRYSI